MEYKQAKTEYPESLRKEIVLEVISGSLTPWQAQKKYSITGHVTVYNWIKWYKQYGVCTFSISKQTRTALSIEKPKPDKQPDNSTEQRIKQLEQQLEDERLLKEMYARMIAIAEQEHKISIRKKTNTR